MPKLATLGIIQTGFQVRGSVRNEGNAPNGVAVIQLGDVRAGEPIDLLHNEFPRMALGWRVPERALLRLGDIVLRSRGGRFSASLVTVRDLQELDGDVPPPTVAAAPLYMLRLTSSEHAPSDKFILPEYVCWYLNQPDVQDYLATQARGTSVVTVSPRTFGEIEIPLPNLLMQWAYVRADAALKEEADLSLLLRNRRAELLRALFDQHTKMDTGNRLPPARNGTDALKMKVKKGVVADVPDEMLPDLPTPTGDLFADEVRIIEQEEINNALWKACDTFRSIIDPEAYKSYILPMLFLKYISDSWREERLKLLEEYEGEEEMVDQVMGLGRFVMPLGSLFQDIYQRRNADNLGEVIDIALQAIEDANPEKLSNVFRNVTYNTDNLGATRERNERLKKLLDDFAALDLRPSRVDADIVGAAYMFLIGKFASDAGKNAGEFFTPREVSILLAKLVRPRAQDRIADPACGSGSLLIHVADEIEGPAHEAHNYSLYGQEMNGNTWALCRMNMFLHREDSAEIEWGDTLRNPKLMERQNDDASAAGGIGDTLSGIGSQLMRFDIVVANPPFSLDKWGAEEAAQDRFRRFRRGVPPKSKGDYAFILHMVETAMPYRGRVGVIVPHGVLFRGGSEGRIRESLIADNLLDAVVGLPNNLFFGTGIPTAILIFDRSREIGGANAERDGVLFIDASRDFIAGRNKNKLRPEDIEKIVQTHRTRREESRYSRRVPASELATNDFNLNIARYIDQFVSKPPVGIDTLQVEIDDLERQLKEVRSRLVTHLKDLEIMTT